MTEFLNNLFANVFGENIILATILISMVPIIELRGAIPFATSTGFWGNIAMDNWTAFGWSLLGSSLIVPLVALIFIPIINWLTAQMKILKSFLWRGGKWCLPCSRLLPCRCLSRACGRALALPCSSG